VHTVWTSMQFGKSSGPGDLKGCRQQNFL
jgi:hypothetical protein